MESECNTLKRVSGGASVTHIVHHPCLYPTKVVWEDDGLVGRSASGTTVIRQTDLSSSVRAVKRVPELAGYIQEISTLPMLPDLRLDLFVQFLVWYEDRNFLLISAIEYVANGDLSSYIRSHNNTHLLEETSRDIARWCWRVAKCYAAGTSAIAT